MTERKAIELVGSMGEDGHEVADPFEHCKGGVAFVEMQHLRLPAERQQDSITADAEQDFLAQPQFVAVAVKLGGNAAVDRVIGWVDD